MSTNQQDRRVGDRSIGGQTKSWPKDPGLKQRERQANESPHEGEDVNGPGHHDGATHQQPYEYVWGSSVYASWGSGFYEARARHEHYLAAQMELRPGMRVLDVVCGIGGPAREIATFSDALVVGVNNDEKQVQRARFSASRAGLEGRVEFVKADIMNIVKQFGENSFDAVYAIGTTCHAPSWEAIYGEIRKVLKPGGVFGVYEWCMTDAWDPSISSHQELAHQLEIGNGLIHKIGDGDGIPKMRPLRALHALPWYYQLEGERRFIEGQMPWNLMTVLSTSWTAKLVIQIFRLFEVIKLIPNGVWEACERFKVTGDALMRGVQMKLFTPMFMVIARKPLEK